MLRRGLLVCGVLSSLLYAAMTIVVAMQWEGYSSTSQTISELSAIGAPTRSLWAVPGALYTLLVTAFGWGVWQSGARSRALRIVGGLLLAYGALGLVWPFAPMHLRETLAAGGGTVSDTMHIVLASVTVLLMLLAIAFGAAAFGRPFRLYSIVTLVILATFGALTFRDAPGIAANLPTPWIGVWERINLGVFLLWVVVLAIALLRVEDTARGIVRGTANFSTTRTSAITIPLDFAPQGRGPPLAANRSSSTCSSRRHETDRIAAISTDPSGTLAIVVIYAPSVRRRPGGDRVCWSRSILPRMCGASSTWRADPPIESRGAKTTSGGEVSPPDRAIFPTLLLPTEPVRLLKRQAMRFIAWREARRPIPAATMSSPTGPPFDSSRSTLPRIRSASSVWRTGAPFES